MEPKNIEVKIDEEYAFNAEWSRLYFFDEFNKMPMCLICKEIISSKKSTTPNDITMLSMHIYTSITLVNSEKRNLIRYVLH